MSGYYEVQLLSKRKSIYYLDGYEDIWRTVADGLVKDNAKQRLEQFRSWNANKDVKYRLIKVIDE